MNSRSTANSTKQDLLDRIEKAEFERIADLSNSAFKKEVLEWFGDNAGNLQNASRIQLINDYMEDYMRWQRDKSLEELTELI